MNVSELLKGIDEATLPMAGYRFAVLAFLIALIVTWVATPFVRKFAFKVGAVDDPKRDERRVHKEPLPRLGGIAIFLGFVVAVCATVPLSHPIQPFPPYLIALLVITLGLVVFGAFDDLRQYSAKAQLAVLLGAGVLIQFFYNGIGRVQILSLSVPLFDGLTLRLPEPWVVVPITAIYLFFVTKTMDTIDGIDGLASGIACISALTICVLGSIGEQPRVAQIAAAVAGASLGFLRHNYHPSRIIMGTGGAYLLGYVLASLSVVGAMKTAATVSLIVPLLVFGVPLFDAAFVVIRRMRAGVPITQADKRHVHHTLLGRGLNQRQTAFALYSVAIVLSVLLILIAVNRGA